MSEKHILVCESGWRGARELSIKLAQDNIASIVLAEGSVEREVQGIITPYSLIKNRFIPEKIFMLYLVFYLFGLLCFPGNRLKVYLNKEKTLKRLNSILRFFNNLKLELIADKR